MSDDEKMSADERRKYLRRMQKRHRKASRRERSALLDEMRAVTGGYRKTMIRLMNGDLARSYGITPQEVRRVFSVGQLYGFRNRIVHRGLLPPIHALLSDYVSARYLDILFERLGLPSGRFAERVQSDPSFDLQSFIA